MKIPTVGNYDYNDGYQRSLVSAIHHAPTSEISRTLTELLSKSGGGDSGGITTNSGGIPTSPPPKGPKLPGGDG